MAETLLLRYGELALKSAPVRREFEGRLRGNLLKAFLRAGVECTVTSDHGHLYLGVADAREAIPVARRVFGLVSVSPVVVLPTDLDALSEHVVRHARDWMEGTRFAIRTRRTGTHPFTSHDVDVRLGADVLRALEDRRFKVDLTAPEAEIEVEIRGPRTYVYTERFPGPGGFPVGVAGNVGAHVTGIRGALGAWMMMKRGCRVYPVGNPSEPGLLDTLARYDPDLDITRSAPDEAGAWTLLGELGVRYRLAGVALPLSVEEYPRARAHWGETVIFSPTVGMTDSEVEARWHEIEELAR